MLRPCNVEALGFAVMGIRMGTRRFGICAALVVGLEVGCYMPCHRMEALLASTWMASSALVLRWAATRRRRMEDLLAST